MKKVQVIFLLISLVSGLAAYTLIFGQVGLIIQKRLSNQLEVLEDTVASLEREHEILQERYVQVQEFPNTKLKVETKGKEVIILKFRNGVNKEFKTNLETARGKINLSEIRGLYFVGFVFLVLIGYVYLGRESTWLLKK